MHFALECAIRGGDDILVGELMGSGVHHGMQEDGKFFVQMGIDAGSSCAWCHFVPYGCHPPFLCNANQNTRITP